MLMQIKFKQWLNCRWNTEHAVSITILGSEIYSMQTCQNIDIIFARFYFYFLQVRRHHRARNIYKMASSCSIHIFIFVLIMTSCIHRQILGKRNNLLTNIMFYIREGIFFNLTRMFSYCIFYR